MEVVQDQTKLLVLYPPVVPASATVTVYGRGSTVLATGTPAVDSVSTTVATATDRENFTVADATGIVAGREYWLVPTSGDAARVRVERKAAAALEVYPPLVDTPAASDVFRGARITYTLPAAATASRGRGLRVEWAVTDTSGAVTKYRTTFDVVRTAFDLEVRSADVVALIATRWGHEVDTWRDDPTRARQLADRAAARVRALLRTNDMYPDLLGDGDEFRAALDSAIRLELFDVGLRDQVDDAGAYRDSLVRTLREDVDLAVAQCTGYDADDSGTAEGDETITAYTRVYR